MSEAQLEVGDEIGYLVLCQILKGLECQANTLLPKIKGSQKFWEDKSGSFVEVGLDRRGVGAVEKGVMVDRKPFWKVMGS